MTVATITVLDALAAQQLVNCLPGLGQAVMASSLPVTLASNQSALSVNSTVVAALPAGSNVIGAVTQSGTWNVGTVTTVTSLSQFAGNAINLGAGAVGTGTLRITQASDSPVVTAMGAVGDAAWASGSGSQIALLKTIAGAALDTTTPSPVSVQTPADVLSFTPTLDTSAYAAGDVLFATVSLGTVTRVNDGRAVLMSLTGIDKSKNKPAMTLLFYQTNVTSAAANAANALSDADQANLLGYVRILAADWIDYANNSIVCKTSINLLLEAVSGAQNVYAVGILDAGTPTFAASDLVFKLGFVQS